VDIQPAMLEKAQNKARDAALDNIEFLHAGAGEGKIGQHRFDRAVMVTVLGEIPEKETALQEVYTALKPGGILSITEIIFDPHFQKRATVSQIADKVGFQEKAFWGNRLAYTLNLKKPEPEI
jgi:ubiquinone/menaquinone biosynthesis C-methylase UbiE